MSASVSGPRFRGAQVIWHQTDSDAMGGTLVLDAPRLEFLEQFDLGELGSFIGARPTGQTARVTRCSVAAIPTGPSQQYAYTWQTEDPGPFAQTSLPRKCVCLPESMSPPPQFAGVHFRSRQFGGAVFSEPVPECQVPREVDLALLASHFCCAGLSGTARVISCGCDLDAFGQGTIGYRYYWYKL